MRKASTEEKRKHSSALVPFSYYECMIPDSFPCVPMHWHSEFEINYVLSGSAEFVCGDEKITTTEGDIVIILPNMLHAVLPVEGMSQHYDTLVFRADMLGASNNDRCSAEFIKPLISGNCRMNAKIATEHRNYKELKIIMESIFSCAKGNTFKFDILLKSELLRFFWLLETSGDLDLGEKRTTGKSEMIRPAIEYINTNFRDIITVEILSELVHLSKSYFMHCFRETVGTSVIEYVTQLRVKNVCALLKETNMTAAEAAYESGFRNVSNFNRQFKRIVGCAPKEYRKLSR